MTSNETRVALVDTYLGRGAVCDDDKNTGAFYLQSPDGHTAYITINHDVISRTKYYLCVKANDSARYIQQGDENYLSIFVIPLPPPEPETILPLPLQVH